MKSIQLFSVISKSFFLPGLLFCTLLLCVAGCSSEYDDDIKPKVVDGVELEIIELLRSQKKIKETDIAYWTERLETLPDKKKIEHYTKLLYSQVERPKEFPPEMAAYRQSYENSALDFLAVTARKAKTQPWDSKFLGHPYLPVGMEYPKDIDGAPLKLLAQINFDDAPVITDYPKTGILQFFIAPGDSPHHIWGMYSYESTPYIAEEYFKSMTEPRYFKVIYHDHVIKDPTQLQLQTPPLPDTMLPIDHEAKLEFEQHTGYVLNGDYRLKKFFRLNDLDFFEQFGDKEYAVSDAYFKNAYQYSIARIGGYAVFSQQDPRKIDPDNEWLLLLETESSRSSDEVDVLWGDAGIGAFFIKRSDLISRNFSNVLIIGITTDIEVNKHSISYAFS